MALIVIINAYKWTTLFGKQFICSLRVVNSLLAPKIRKQKDVCEHLVKGIASSIVSDRDHGDTFGDFRNSELDILKDDINDGKLKEKLSKYECIQLIDHHLKANEYDNAVAALRKLQKSTRAPPYCYRLLFNYNASRGAIHESYSLYLDFVKRNYYVGHPFITTLFTCCANSQRTDVALEKAYKIWNDIKKKEIVLNLINYHAILKAFGRNGDMQMSFQVFDDLEKSGHQVNGSTYSFLLESCRSDKNSGLMMALMVWHKMLQKGVRPNNYTFQQMLICLRDCSLGEEGLIQDVFKGIMGCSKNSPRGKHQMRNPDIAEVRVINGKSEVNIVKPEMQSAEYFTNDVHAEIPNLLEINPNFGSIMAFGDFSKLSHRIALFGGLQGFLKVLTYFQVDLDSAMLSIILECLPPTVQAEEELIEIAQNHKVKIDSTVLNVLVCRMIRRSEKSKVEDYIDLFKQYHVLPDVVTFGTLAVSCKRFEDGVSCIQLAEEWNVRLNTSVMNILLNNARRSLDMRYVSAILSFAKKNDIQLDFQFVSNLKYIIQRSKKKVNE